LEELWRRKEIVDDDLILVTAVSYPKSGNRMNLIQTHKVADLRDSLAWAVPATQLHAA
jgi:pyruvate kinase